MFIHKLVHLCAAISSLQETKKKINYPAQWEHAPQVKSVKQDAETHNYLRAVSWHVAAGHYTQFEKIYIGDGSWLSKQGLIAAEV